jgi:hypothetical protein
VRTGLRRPICSVTPPGGPRRTRVAGSLCRTRPVALGSHRGAIRGFDLGRRLPQLVGHPGEQFVRRITPLRPRERSPGLGQIPHIPPGHRLNQQRNRPTWASCPLLGPRQQPLSLPGPTSGGAGLAASCNRARASIQRPDRSATKAKPRVPRGSPGNCCIPSRKRRSASLRSCCSSAASACSQRRLSRWRSQSSAVRCHASTSRWPSLFQGDCESPRQRRGISPPAARRFTPPRVIQRLCMARGSALYANRTQTIARVRLATAPDNQTTHIRCATPRPPLGKISQSLPRGMVFNSQTKAPLRQRPHRSPHRPSCTRRTSQPVNQAPNRCPAA